MTNTFPTLNDVRELLSSMNLDWTGSFYNEKQFTYTQATEENFFNNSNNSLKLKCNKNKIIVVNITKFTLSIDEQDYSEQWQNLLLKNYELDYAVYLFLWSKYMCEIIEKNCSSDKNEEDVIKFKNMLKLYKELKHRVAIYINNKNNELQK